MPVPAKPSFSVFFPQPAAPLGTRVSPIALEKIDRAPAIAFKPSVTVRLHGSTVTTSSDVFLLRKNASANLRRKAYVYVFALLGFVFAMFYVWNLPPFMGPDESAHIHRADMPLLGRLTGFRGEGLGGVYAGGPIDAVVREVMDVFVRIVGKPEALSKADYEKAKNVGWDDRTIFFPYPTALYPPFFYIPQTIALAVGKSTGLSIVGTIYLARTANAIVCIAIALWALSIAGRAWPAIFTILLLPMSVMHYATVTQDGLSLVTTALGCAFITGAVSGGRKMTSRELCGAAVCFALVGMSKPPYAAFALVLLAAPVERPKLKYAAAAAALSASIGWAVWMVLAVGTKQFNPVMAPDAGEQLRFLLNDPIAIFAIAKDTLAAYIPGYSKQFVGVLGWLDTPLPPAFYPVAGAILFLSYVLSASRGGYRAMTPVTVLVAVISIALIFGSIYLGWTSVGAPIVEGVQGRYFLPVAMLLVLAVVRERPLVPAGGVVERVAFLTVLIFPVLTLMIVERTIILRYYLG